MPFKTRKAKISAASHRFTFFKEQVFDYEGKGTKTETKSVNLSNIKRENLRTIENDYDYVKGDLVKISLLTTLIIFCQIGLFFFLKYH